MRKQNWKVFLAGLSVLASCQAPPTRMQSEEKVFAGAVESANSYAQRVMSSEPIILDARSALDYGVSHVPGSVNVLWSDFSRPSGQTRDLGVLDPDSESLAKRLALWGVRPDRAVLVIGNSQNFGIEAARVAWMLKFLGVEKVYLGSEKVFRGTLPRGSARPENAKPWIPSVRQGMQMSLEDFLRRLGMKSRTGILQKTSAKASVALEQKVVAILDVGEIPRQWPKTPTETPVIKIPWKNFLTAEGRGKENLRQLLQQNKVPEQGLVVVVGDDGVQGCGVTFVLSEEREQVSCFSAGWPAIQRSISTP